MHNNSGVRVSYVSDSLALSHSISYLMRPLRLDGLLLFASLADTNSISMLMVSLCAAICWFFVKKSHNSFAPTRTFSLHNCSKEEEEESEQRSRKNVLRGYNETVTERAGRGATCARRHPTKEEKASQIVSFDRVNQSFDSWCARARGFWICSSWKLLLSQAVCLSNCCGLLARDGAS